MEITEEAYGKIRHVLPVQHGEVIKVKICKLYLPTRLDYCATRILNSLLKIGFMLNDIRPLAARIILSSTVSYDQKASESRRRFPSASAFPICAEGCRREARATPESAFFLLRLFLS